MASSLSFRDTHTNRPPYKPTSFPYCPHNDKLPSPRILGGGVEAEETRSIIETVGGDLAFGPPADVKLHVEVQVVELFDESDESVGRDRFTEADRAALSQLEVLREDLYH